MNKENLLDDMKYHHNLVPSQYIEQEFNKFIEVLEDFYNQIDDYKYTSIKNGNFIENYITDINEFLKEYYYQIEQVDKYGGEGKGDDYYHVYRILDTRINNCFYIKWEGYYSSYSSVEWGEYNIVFPEIVEKVEWNY